MYVKKETRFEVPLQNELEQAFVIVIVFIRKRKKKKNIPSENIEKKIVLPELCERTLVQVSRKMEIGCGKMYMNGNMTWLLFPTLRLYIEVFRKIFHVFMKEDFLRYCKCLME